MSKLNNGIKNLNANFKRLKSDVEVSNFKRLKSDVEVSKNVNDALLKQVASLEHQCCRNV